MKKLALVLLAGFSYATAANAQSFALGLKAGANIANVNGSGVSGTSSLVNFNGGVYAKIGFGGGLALQPELVYSGQGFKEDDNGTTGTQHQNYFNIPVLLKYTHPTGLFIETGPQLGFLMSAKASESGVSVDDKSSFNSTDFSWVVGVGVKIPTTPVSVDLRYNFGLSNIVNDNNSGSSSESVHNGCFQIGVMVRLFSIAEK